MGKCQMCGKVSELGNVVINIMEKGKDTELVFNACSGCLDTFLRMVYQLKEV
jgi:hypothetical protein